MKKVIISISVGILLISILAGGALAQTAETGQAYVAQAGDSLWKLADKYLGNGNLYPAIVEATNQKAADDTNFGVITDANVIQPGQQLWIPAADEATMPQSAEPVAEQPAAAAPVVTVAAVAGEPTGHIAFSFFNPSADRCTYEVNIVSVPDCLAGDAQCQASRRIYALNNVSEPALSPDGTTLAFRSWGEPRSEDSPYIDCAPAHPYRNLGHASLDGTGFVSTGQYWEDSHPDWSPDGNRLLFDSDSDEKGVPQLYLINADGTGEQSLLLAGQQPSWAPDNTRFVYRGCDLTGNQCGLWTAVAFEPKSWDRGQNLIASITLGDQVAHPDWSPVRDEVVYQRNENGVWNLWLVNADGSNDHALTTGDTLRGLPVWSPDGEWIAYLSNDGQNWQIRMVSRDGIDDRLVFTFDGGQFTVPFAEEPYGSRDWIDEQISWSK